MSKDIAIAERPGSKVIGAADHRDFVSVTVAGQVFGIPVLQVQDVLGPQRITRIPLAPAEVAGSLNLRGRIVTAIDMRRRLGLPPRSDDKPSMAVGIELKGESYGLLIDAVGEVMKLGEETREPNPVNLDGRLARVSGGVHRLDGQLMVILDVDHVLNTATEAMAA